MPEDKPDRKLGRYGVIATIVYLLLLAFGIPTLAHIKVLEIDSVTLNELGDFLAGAFGPLAIFWLVLGFFQQGHELRLQVKELANSVSQQKEMVNVTREGLLHEKEILVASAHQRKKQMQPNFVPYLKASSRQGLENYIFKLEIRNTGSVASEIRYYAFMGERELFRGEKASFGDFDRMETPVDFGDGAFPDDSLRLKFLYKDHDGDEQESIVELAPPQDMRRWSDSFTIDIIKKPYHTS